MSRIPPQPLGGNQDPVTVQLDPKCLQPILEELLVLLETNDPRTDFSLKESEKLDRDYVRNHNDILNNSLIFAGLLSVVVSMFIIHLLPKIEPNPNDPNSAAWTGSPPRTSTALLLLEASFTISVLVVYFAIAGRQWTDQYLQPRGGSAADENWDRQRELNGFQKWHVSLCIKGPPLMLLPAIALLCSALFL